MTLCDRNPIQLVRQSNLHSQFVGGRSVVGANTHTPKSHFRDFYFPSFRFSILFPSIADFVAQLLI
jgi:hypothetical protein